MKYDVRVAATDPQTAVANEGDPMPQATPFHNPSKEI